MINTQTILLFQIILPGLIQVFGSRNASSLELLYPVDPKLLPECRHATESGMAGGGTFFT